MDLETFILKSSQLNNNIYCIKNKPFFTIGYDFKGLFRSTHYDLSTNLYIPNEKDEPFGNFRIKTFDDKYPSTSVEIVPFKIQSLDIMKDNCKLSFNPSEYSLCINFSQDNLYKYGLKYNIKSPISITASFNYNDFYYYSTRFSEENMSLFGGFTIYQDEMFLGGIKLVNRGSFLDSLNHIYCFSKFKMITNYYSYAISVSDDIKIAISKYNDNKRSTFAWRKIFDLESIDYRNTDFIYQCKYVSTNKNKFAYGLNLSELSFFTRASLQIDLLKIKFSAKIDFEKGFQPSYGLFFTNKLE